MCTAADFTKPSTSSTSATVDRPRTASSSAASSPSTSSSITSKPLGSPEKVPPFTGRGARSADLPSRLYGGALKRTRRYFALKLPIAADHKSAIFVYADPGRHTDRELRRWADEHHALWTHLRAAGTEIHVAAVVRSRAAQDQYERLLTAWLSPPALAPLTPEESDTLAAIERALRSGQPDALAPWGGFLEARRILLPLRQRAERAGAAAERRFDACSAHFSHRLADPGEL